MSSSQVFGCTLRNGRRLSLCLAIILATVASLLPLRATLAGAQAACRNIGAFEVCGRFLDEWSKQGSDQANIYVNGLPITSARSEISLDDGKAYTTQWFERAKYEAHPENKAPYDMLFGRLGASLSEGRGIIDPYTNKVRNTADQPFVGIDKPADADGKAIVWFPETHHSIAARILEYWNRYGGLQQFGFPLSEPFQEISEADYKTYTVQYFERNRFELHPEKPAPYEVELGLLGVQQYKLQPIAGDNLPIAPPSGVKSSKDTLVIGVGVESLTLDPDNSDVTFLELPPLISLGLVGIDEKGDYYPQLAWYAPTVENGGARFAGIGEDRHLQVKWKLRPGMKWSDGVEITSTDVVFNYKTLRDHDFSGDPDPAVEKLHNIDNPDKYTVIANYMSYTQAVDIYNSTTDKEHFAYLKDFIDRKEPVTAAWYLNSASATYPEHILGKIPYLKRDEMGYYNDPSLMVTNGPFKVDRWDHDQQLVLVRNPYYSLTAPPILTKVVYRFIPDQDARIAQLKSGDVDVLLGQTFTSPDAQLEQLKQAGMTVDNAPGPYWEHLDFNLGSPYFKEKEVRQAIAYAINRQKVVDEVSPGKWQVQNTMVPPFLWTSVEHPNFPQEWKEKFPLHLYPYDPARANQMLDQAGWVKGSDGIRTKGGVPLSFRYDTTLGEFRGRTQALFQADLKAVGIEANIAQQPGTEFFDALSTRDFDLSEYAWIQSDPLSGGDAYDSANIPSLEDNFAGANRPGYRNAHFDELNRAASSELDRSREYPIQAELQAIYSEDLPSIPLFTRTNINAHKPNLANWDPGFGGSALNKAAAIYFK